MTLDTLKVFGCSFFLMGVVALVAQLPAQVMADGSGASEVIITSIFEPVVAFRPAQLSAIVAQGEGEKQGKRGGKPDQYARFVSADETKNIITVLAREGEANLIIKTLKFAKDVEITVDLGRQAKFSDLKEGNDLQLWLASDKSSVVSIHAESQVRFGRWRGRDPGNVPKAIDGEKLTITFPEGEGHPGDYVFPVAKDAEVKIGRKPAKLKDLTTEHRVLVKLSVDDKTVIQITQLGRGDEEE